MKEITRIHIAKVAYDIELDAKKDIEEYVRALERYANDPDIMDDIEIRITELLAEHGVLAGGVIGGADVKAVRAQLGEPSDFAAEGATEAVEAIPTSEEARRVYRDTDNAMLGGVLAGLANYLRVDPLWVRLVFVVLLFASFGTATIIYLVLWLIIPPAETAAEKLRMSGQPVTLESIKELVRREDRQDERSRTLKHVLSVFGGVFLVLVAIGGLLAIAAAVGGIGWGGYVLSAEDVMSETWWFLPTMGAFVLSGLLFSALFFILAIAAFQRKWSKRIGTAVISIIAAGLVIFASGVGLGIYGYGSEQQRINDLVETRRIEPAVEIKDIKKLQITSDGAIVDAGVIEYIVSDNPRFELSGLPGIDPVIATADDGATLRVKLVKNSQEMQNIWGYLANATLTIYGPALGAIEVDGGSQAVRYYNGRAQNDIKISGESGSFNLVGTYRNVHVTSKNTAVISLSDAAIESLEADVPGGSVTAGVIRTLSVKQSDVCPAREYYDVRHTLQVQAVASGKMLYNGKSQAAKSVLTECGGVIIGDDENDSYDYGKDSY